MTIPNKPPEDPRSTIELINLALTEVDDDVAWEYVVALHWRGTREVHDAALSLCRSQCARERELGAGILSQLGVFEPAFPEERFAILVDMLSSENNVDVLRSIFQAFWFLHDVAAVPVVAPFRTHADPEVRVSVAMALSGNEDALAIHSLIEMSTDDDPEVRDWATFGLGTQTEFDSPELREALIRRLTDDDDETRGEAQVGLARRRDCRVIPSIHASLRSASVDHFSVEAAELIADPALAEPLRALLKERPEDCDLLERAIKACCGARHES